MAAKKEDPQQVNLPTYAQLNLDKKNDEVWLASAPRMLVESWEKIKTPTQIGTVRITEDEDGNNKKIEILLAYNNGVYPVAYKDFASEYELKLSNGAPSPQFVFSHNKETGYVRIQGKVNDTPRLVPKDDMQFLKMQKNAAVAPPPKSLHQFVSDGKKKYVAPQAPIRQEKRDRRLAKSENEIRTDILNFFNKFEEGTMKEISDFVDQNPTNVKPVLEKLGVYNSSKSVWSLSEDLKQI